MDLYKLLNPSIKIQTSQGELNLYKIGVAEPIDISNLDNISSSELVRELLEYVIGFPNQELEIKGGNKKRATREQISSLNEKDVEAIAAECLGDVTQAIASNQKVEEKSADQSNVDYLSSLLKIYIPLSKKRNEKISNSLNLLKKVAADFPFNPSEDQTAALRHRRTKLPEEIYKPPPIPKSYSDRLAEENALLTRDSKLLLEQLASNAALFMGTADLRDIQAKRQFKTQLYIAVAGIWFSVIPALIGLWFSYKSYDLSVQASKEDEGVKSQIIKIIENQNLEIEMLRKEIFNRETSNTKKAIVRKNKKN